MKHYNSVVTQSAVKIQRKFIIANKSSTANPPSHHFQDKMWLYITYNKQPKGSFFQTQESHYANVLNSKTMTYK